MENLLQNIAYVVVRVYDIVASGASDEDHLNNLEQVLMAAATVELSVGRLLWLPTTTPLSTNQDRNVQMLMPSANYPCQFVLQLLRCLQKLLLQWNFLIRRQ